MEEETKKDNEEIDANEINIVDEVDGAQAKIAKLKKDIEICRKEKDDYLNGWRRAKADFINVERDLARHETENRKYVEMRIMKELLAVADDFEKAFASSPPDSPWLEGVKMIYSNLKALLASRDVQKIDAVGKEFNPEFHEAIEVKQTDQESDDNMIVEEFQSGYILGERVLRAAKVKVAKYQSN